MIGHREGINWSLWLGKFIVMHLSTYRNLGFALVVLLIKDLHCDYTDVYVEYEKENHRSEEDKELTTTLGAIC